MAKTEAWKGEENSKRKSIQVYFIYEYENEYDYVCAIRKYKNPTYCVRLQDWSAETFTELGSGF